MIFEMTPKDIPPITPERWLGNILEALSQIADRERQESRWLAADAFAWEHPDELINTVDDVVFEGFLENYTPTFSKEQRDAAFGFRDALKNYCELTPQNLNPAETLADPRWELIRQKASAFVAAFSKKWPSADADV